MWNSSNSSNVVWSVDYSNSANASWTAVTTSSNNITFTFAVKRCRSCKHSHVLEGMGCYDTNGISVAYVTCSCKEHVPEDNLEYLEYLLRKKESI